MQFELTAEEQLEKSELVRKSAELMAKDKLSVSEAKQADLILSRLAAFRGRAERVATLKAWNDRDGVQTDVRMLNPTQEQKASFELRSMLLEGKEQRTYAAMSLTGDAALLASQFANKLVQAQAVSGPFYAESGLLSNIVNPKNNTLKLPVVDDTASTGYVQTENGPVTEAEVVGFAAASLGTKTFSSGICLASLELVQDVSSWVSYENLLIQAIAKRLSRIQNATFVPQLMASLAANSSAAVSAASLDADSIVELIGSVDSEYRKSPQCAFVMNSSTQQLLGLLKSSTGQRIFKHVLDATPSIYDYPVSICKNLDSVGSGKAPVLFGDFSTVFTRSIAGFDVSLIRESFLLSGQCAIIVRKRADLAYSLPSTSDSAVKYISIS